MVCYVVKLCLFITSCGVVITSGVESNWNADNGEDMFVPFESDLKSSKTNEVIKNWNRDNGEPMFSLPKRESHSAINDETVSNLNRDNGTPLFIPPNTDLVAVNPVNMNKGRLIGGQDMYKPGQILSSHSSVKSRAQRSHGTGEASQWILRASKLQLPHYYYN